MRALRCDPSVQCIVKFWPHIPPERGDIVIVDGVRCRVTRAKVRYQNPDEPCEWTLHKLYVKSAPA